MSFDSFHTSGNRPGRHTQLRRTASLGFGFAGPAVELPFILDRRATLKKRALDIVVEIQKHLGAEAA